MKILELRFKNLNSLYGEWSIDFTSPEYGANGIFALTGPTGAGKSTILDAICLALYGATPRLGKITKSANEIMSRQTGECSAEVIFESQSRKFMCTWSQHRANKKANGKLADSRHEIADVISGQVLASKKRQVAEVVEEKTGMDFERFTRSILLAQGGFDTFLKADAEQKSKILEQITGTGIYTEISKRVHESQRSERDKLNVLMAETSGIELLTDEQLVEIQTSLVEDLKKKVEVGAQVKEIERSIAWLKGLGGLRNEINDLLEESKGIDLAIEEFKPDRQRLTLALRASELDGAFAILKRERKQQNEDEQAFKEISENLPILEQAVAKKGLGLESAEKLVLNGKKEQTAASITFQKVRMLDQQLKDKQQEINAGKNEYNRIAEKLTSHKKQFEQNGEEHTKVKDDLQSAQVYLEKNKQDESLIANLAVVEEQFATLVKSQSEVSTKYKVLSVIKKQRTKATGDLDSLSEKVKLEKTNLENVQQTRELKKEELGILLAGKLLREYRAEKDRLLKEIAYLSKIASLEAERNQLKDGKACPLCGSEVHPYAEGNIPAVDETQKKIEFFEVFIVKCEKLEQEVLQQQQLEKEVVQGVTALEKSEAKSVNDLAALTKQSGEIDSEVQQKNSALNELKTLLLTKLQSLGIEKLPDDVFHLLHSLKSRLTNWQETQRKKEALEKQLLEIEANLKSFEVVVKTQSEDLTLKQESINKLSEELKVFAEERELLFGAKNANIEEETLNKVVLKAEHNEKSCRTARDEAKQTCHSAKIKIETLKKQIDKRDVELLKLESDFVLSLTQHNFVDEENYHMSCLPKLELEQLNAQAKSLDERFISLQTKKKDRQNRLETEVEKKITSSTLDELEAIHKDLQSSLAQLTENIHGLRSKISANETAREKIKEKQVVIDLQKMECSKWDKLHALIGSADGKKFRNFAQGLTFQLMVSHANRQLEKMTDRYLLIRDEKQPLELNVIDNYQGGEIRSTKNLSGGESFVVSLTLALGLSKMASRKVRVDSLFLDEGFGTLDEEALETALETLAGLQQDGKIIGVISHVPALKERISTQITVRPQSGGKSLVAGPGCTKVA